MSTAILEIPVPNRQPPSASAAARLPLLDATRLLAAYAIVWLHTPQSLNYARWTAPARFAVPLFTAAAVLLVWQGAARGRRRRFREYAQARFVRIYIPFLAWSAVYLAFKAIKARLLPDQANVFPGVELFWLGSFYHLWFMPFILGTTLLVFALAQQIAGHRMRENALFALALAAGWVVAWWPVDRSQSTVTFAQLAADALPSACWGLALAIAWQRDRFRWLRRPTSGAVALVIAVVLSAALVFSDRNRAAENLAGVAMLIFALGEWRSPLVERLARLGSLAYGIYLAHPLFIKVIQSIAAKLSIAESPIVLVGTFAAAALGSTLLAYALGRSRFTRWLVG